MPLYRYKAKDSQNAIKEGVIEATNEQIASSSLKEQGLLVVSMNIEKTGGLNIAILNRVKEKDVVIFSRQFAVMISASIPVVQALKVLVGQTENIKLQGIVSEIAEEVNAGSRLSDALSKRNKIFSTFYVSVIRAGETSGKLDEVLNYLADEMEKDYDLMHKIKGAMIYPIFVIVGMVAVGAVMMIWVVPKLTAVIAESGGDLPVATKILIATSNFLAAYWWLLIILIVGIIGGIKYYIKLPAGRYQFDYIRIKIPIFGPLIQKIALVRFTRSMQTLIVGGVPVASGLQIAADVVDNAVYRDLILEAKKGVEGGSTISSIFLEHDEIPSMVSQMFAVGEKTGKLDLVLRRITDFYSREVSNVVANLVTLIEPVIMVIMGIAVGIMVAAIIMPMYNMASQF